MSLNFHTYLLNSSICQSFPYKITAGVTKSSHQDRGPCYLQLLIFFFYIHSSLLLQNKKLLRLIFMIYDSKLDHRPLFTYIYCETILVGICFNMNKKHHIIYYTKPLQYTPCQLKYVQFQSLLFYSELNQVHGAYV